MHIAVTDGLSSSHFTTPRSVLVELKTSSMNEFPDDDIFVNPKTIGINKIQPVSRDS